MADHNNDAKNMKMNQSMGGCKWRWFQEDDLSQSRCPSLTSLAIQDSQNFQKVMSFLEQWKYETEEDDDDDEHEEDDFNDDDDDVSWAITPPQIT